MSSAGFSVRNTQGSAEIPMAASSIDAGGGLLFSFLVELADRRTARFQMRLDGFGVLALALAALRSKGRQAKDGPVRVTLVKVETPATKEEEQDGSGNQ